MVLHKVITLQAAFTIFQTQKIVKLFGKKLIRTIYFRTNFFNDFFNTHKKVFGFLCKDLMGSNRVPISGVECFKERVIKLEGLKDEKDRKSLKIYTIRRTAKKFSLCHFET